MCDGLSAKLEWKDEGINEMMNEKQEGAKEKDKEDTTIIKPLNQQNASPHLKWGNNVATLPNGFEKI